MKSPIIFILLFLALTSCSSSSVNERLSKEIGELTMKNKQLQTELDEFENSIVIPADEIHDYIMPLTFGQIAMKTNEEITFETHLVLQKLPDNIKSEWTCNPEAMSLKNEGLRHFVKNMYETARTIEFRGAYTLSFPNGMEKELEWHRELEIK